jgi:hypothetical protein
MNCLRSHNCSTKRTTHVGTRIDSTLVPWAFNELRSFVRPSTIECDAVRDAEFVQRSTKQKKTNAVINAVVEADLFCYPASSPCDACSDMGGPFPRAFVGRMHLNISRRILTVATIAGEHWPRQIASRDKRQTNGLEALVLPARGKWINDRSRVGLLRGGTRKHRAHGVPTTLGDRLALFRPGA